MRRGWLSSWFKSIFIISGFITITLGRCGVIRILFVDDEQELLDIGKCFLETHPDFVVDTIQSAHQALTFLKKYQYDAIISDYLMPEIDGLVFLQKVRSLNPTIPFIFFTGQGDEKTVIDALNNGADFYLKKNYEAGSQFLELSQLIKLSVGKVRSENALIKSEDKFRTIADFTYDWIYWVDPDESLAYISPSCKRITGYTQEEFYSDPGLITRVVHPDDLETWLSHRERTVDQIDFHTLDIRIVQKDGNIRWMNHTCQAVYGHGGEYLGQKVNNRDITHRKKIEKQLQEEHDNFLKIFQAAPVGLLLMNQDTVITWANESIASLFRRDQADIISERGGGGLGCIHSYDTPRGCGYSTYCPDCPLRKGIESVISGGTSIHGAVIPLTLRIGGTDQKRWLNVSAEPVEIDGLDHLIVAVEDITRKREIEEALRESEEKFRTLSENTPAAIMIYRDDSWIYANPAAERITGYSQEELLSKQFWDIIHPDCRDHLKLQGKARIQGTLPDSVIYDLVIIRADGLLRRVELVASSILLGGKKSGLITAVDITERKAAEEKLLKSEEKFRSIFENQIDLYYQADIDGIIKVLSPSCEVLTGYKPSDLVGRSVLSLYPYPEQREKFMAVLLEMGAVYDYEVTLKNKSGLNVPVSVNSHIISGIDGKPDRIEGTIRDITERTRMEKDLRRSEEHYRSLFVHMFEGFACCRMIYDKQGNPEDWIFLNVNQSFEKQTGLKNIEGKKVTEVIPSIKELSPELFSIYHRVIATGIPETFETEFKPLKIWFNINVYSIEKDHFVVIFENITSRKQDELKLKSLNRDLKMILENVPAMIWYKDTHNNFLQVNRAACIALGRPSDKIVGKNFSEIYPQKSDLYYQDDLDVINSRKPKLGIVDQFITAGGEEIWIQTDKVPIVDDGGTVTGILVLGIDITERIRANNAITLVNKKLNLLSTITRHDILNQVQGLFLSLELAASGPINPEIRAILENAMNFSKNIQRQLAFTRDYQNIGVNSPEWQNVSDLISRVAPALGLGSISLKIEIEGLYVYADPLLEKVFHNLIDNAKRYGKTITVIRFYGRESYEGYILCCEDNGVGIPDQHKEGIFKREYYQHTGFGLNLSREILDITGLSIRETGEAGRGARFEIIIPKGQYRFSL